MTTPVSSLPPKRIWEQRPLLCALLLISFFSLIRLWIAGSGQLDLAQDEAQYWDWSRRLQLSYYSKGPLIAWLIRAGTSCFGNTELGVRLMAVVNNFLVQGLLFYWIGVLIGRIRLGFLILLLVNAIPLFIVSGVLMTTDNPLLLCWLISLVALHQLGEHPYKKWPLPVLGLAMAAGILAKYTMLLMLPLSLAYIAILVWRGQIERRTLVALASYLFAGACLGLLPIFLWNMENDFASFRHVARLAGVSGGPAESIPLIRFDRFPEYIGGQAGLLLPWWLGIMIWYANRLLKETVTFCRKPSHLLSNMSSSGMSQKANDNAPEKRFRLHLLLCLGFWPLWLFFILWSFHTRIYPNWSAMSYVAGIIITAMGIEQLLLPKESSKGIALSKKQLFFSGKRWLPLWAGLSVFTCVIIHGQHIITEILPLPEKYNPTVRLKGWSDLGRRLEEIRKTMPNPDQVFFFSDAYDVTAALAFYAPKQPVTYCSDFGRRLSQYDFWPDPNNDTFLTVTKEHSTSLAPRPDSPRFGWSAIYVSRRPHRVPSELFPMFHTVKKEETFSATHKGQKGRTFGIVPLEGYTGVWNRPSQGIY